MVSCRYCARRPPERAAFELLTDFRDRVVKMSMAYGHLVVATTAQCLIYKTTNWHTPVVFELKSGALRYIKQSRDMIMLLDNVNGIQIDFCFIVDQHL